MGEYLERAYDGLIRELLGEMPAILLVGARAVGKTTTAMRFARTVVHLDRDADAAAFRADPDVALRGLQEPVLLDEWQFVPAVLAAVKRAVDEDPRPGRFILTGSVRADLEAETWPGTGRLMRVVMTGLSMRERVGSAAARGLLARLADDGPGHLPSLPPDAPDLRGYVDLALSGAYPVPALHVGGRGRQRWLRGYLDQLITRDVAQFAGERDPVRLRTYFEALAAHTGTVVGAKTLYDAVGLNAKTAAAYDRLLSSLFVLDMVPSWTSNRLKRLLRAPKRYIVDPGLAAAATAADTQGVLRDGDLLGRILDTFVTAQLRSELAAAGGDARLFHLRTEQGRREADALVEWADGRVIGVEVKADSAPSGDAARHLVWLRDRLGERFVAGVVFHTGPRPFQHDDRILMLPICSLWG
jgi:predicted AAA+ superfamily ATPase